jgi:hypothetical protein
VTAPDVRLITWQGPLTGQWYWQAYSLLAGRTPLAMGGPAATRADALAAGRARYPDAVEATTIDPAGWVY